MPGTKVAPPPLPPPAAAADEQLEVENRFRNTGALPWYYWIGLEKSGNMYYWQDGTPVNSGLTSNAAPVGGLKQVACQPGCSHPHSHAIARHAAASAVSRDCTECTAYSQPGHKAYSIPCCKSGLIIRTRLCARSTPTSHTSTTTGWWGGHRTTGPWRTMPGLTTCSLAMTLTCTCSSPSTTSPLPGPTSACFGSIALSMLAACC